MKNKFSSYVAESFLDFVIMGGGFIVVFSLLLFACGGCSISINSKTATKNEYNNGAEARKNGVPADANPYVFTDDRVGWLKGWMEAGMVPHKEKAE